MAMEVAGGWRGRRAGGSGGGGDGGVGEGEGGDRRSGTLWTLPLLVADSG